MAHIRKRGRRKDGSTVWQARYTDPARGGTHKVERTFRTRDEAQDWITQQQHSIRTGTYISPKQAERPFRDVLTAWQESWVNLSPTTRDRYRSILENYLKPTFATQPIARVTHEQVQRYVNTLTQNGHAPGTTRNIYACLRNACSKGVRMGMLLQNPCSQIDLPSSPREEMLFLTPEQVTALATTIDPHYRTLVYTAAYTGLRAGELLALQRQDLNLRNGTLAVRRARREVSGKITTGPTKTAGSRRTISLPTFLRQMLAAHLTTVSIEPTALVFASKTNKPLRHNLWYRRHFKPAVRHALPPPLHGLRFHDLRHTCASLSIAAGAHPKLISARLGHSSIAITLDRYGHLFPSVEESLAQALDVAYAEANGQQEASGTVASLRPAEL